MASIEFAGVTKRFADGTEALVDINLQINDGELMVLLGPSGCGKSTALRLLAGLEQPTTGELRLDGAVINSLAPQQRNIAMVFQNYALYPHMSVRRNLAFPLRMLRLSSDEITRRTTRVANMLQLESLLDRLPKQLSGGQRQRVAMGRAIVREPRAFLMDEPLSNLDVQLRVQIRNEISALQQRLGITTLYVTHDQVEAMTLGDRVAVMHAGRLQQVDSPQEVYAHPANTFVAQFVGNPGMNVYTSHLQHMADGIACEFAGKWWKLPVSGRVSYARLQPLLDQPVFIGLRPEAFFLAEEEDTGIKMRLRAVEMLGHEQLLYIDAEQASGSDTVVRLQGTASLAAGDIIHLSLQTRDIHVFDDKGNAL